MKPLAPNTLIQNRYLIVQLIGKGGMGDVYLAVDQRLGSAIALKRTFFADDEMLGGAFEREAKILARLRHPVLPKVSDHFTDNEEQFLVMEHISGDDLFKRLEIAKKPFPLSWVLFWADQLLDALSYLHTNEPPIIHRDIKPQNLKLTDENHIVLLDFGLSKNSAGETQFTNSGSVVGYTPHYAPMEQIRGMGTSPRSDIYALSATLYQLMSNTIPADALSRADALLNGMPDPLIPVYEVNPEIQPVVSDVIMTGMEISQDKRHQTARDMQKGLRDAFAEMQSAMAAQTVAFTMPVTESVAARDTAPPPPLVAVAEAPVTAEAPVSAEPGSFVTADSELDATLRYNPPAEEAVPDKEDTLPVSAEETPAAESIAQPAPDDEFPTVESSRLPAGALDPFATIMTEPPGPENVPETPEAAFAPPVETAPVPAPPVRETAPASAPAAAALAAVPAKKSSKKGLAVGILAALFLFIAAGGAGGWFVYQKYYAGVTATPTPVPSPAATGSPTPEMPVEINTGDNSNIATVPDVNSNRGTNTVTEGTPKPAVKATPVKTPPPAKTPPPRLKTEL